MLRDRGPSLAEACWSYGEAKLLSVFFVVAKHRQVPERQQLKIFTLKLKNRFLGSWLQLLRGLRKREQCMEMVSKQVQLFTILWCAPRVSPGPCSVYMLPLNYHLQSTISSLFPLICRWQTSHDDPIICKFHIQNEWLDGSKCCGQNSQHTKLSAVSFIFKMPLFSEECVLRL